VVTGVLGLVLPLSAATSASASTPLVVRPSSMGSWTAQTNDATGTAVPFGTCANGTVSFVPGPAMPPLGVGSAELTTGNGTPGGDCDAQLRNSANDGVQLSNLTALSYYTYVKKNNGRLSSVRDHCSQPCALDCLAWPWAHWTNRRKDIQTTVRQPARPDHSPRASTPTSSADELAMGESMGEVLCNAVHIEDLTGSTTYEIVCGMPDDLLLEHHRQHGER